MRLLVSKERPLGPQRGRSQMPRKHVLMHARRTAPRSLRSGTKILLPVRDAIHLAEV